MIKVHLCVCEKLSNRKSIFKREILARVNMELDSVTPKDRRNKS